MTTWWSRWVLLGAVGAAALLPVGALGSRFGLWPFSGGMLMMTIGSALSVVGVAGGLAATIVAGHRALTGDLRASALGLTVSFLVVAYAGLLFYQASSVPPIHNISTDVADPPPFIAIVPRRGDGANPLDFDSEKLAPLHRQFYPWVQPLASLATPENALAKARAALEDLGMEIVAEHPDSGLIEATDTTFWFGFKDDVAVRVRPTDQGSVVDVRSVSRVGQGDLGKNAQRIGEILAHISSQ